VTGDASGLTAAAEVIVTDLGDGWSLADIASAAAPSAVVVAITPFGTSGPYVDRELVVNEFVLQALCGSIGGRGWPGSEPMQAGGRLGEWFAGAYAAVVVAASVRAARRTGSGQVVDLSVFESMAIVMGSLGAVSSSVLGDDQTMGRRSLELPSIVPTADGLVGFCTITAQQFQDFLVLIDRPDLIDDADLASMPGRIKRRDEFLSMVHDWAADKTTDEIIDLATAFRIPVTPIATPQTILSIDHFVERGVFVESEGGAVAPSSGVTGDTRDPGAIDRQSFVGANRDEWRLEIDPAKALTYTVRRGGADQLRIEFPIERQVASPPPPWGQPR
jgi:crotonobetainyl-CoA:carnitine CoA-transferase CaiB-like acyl-CoA transferase